MASLLGESVGARVGYRVRHESRSSAETRILVVTEGVLVRRLQIDPSLSGVSAVVFDEFHERSIDADLSLALCREAQLSLRPEIRLLVMSATLGEVLAPAVAALLGDSPALRSEGRSYPVAVRYVGAKPLAMLAASSREIESEMSAAIRNVLRENNEGDVLAFLPGEREIRNVAGLLNGGPSAAVQVRRRALPTAAPIPLPPPLPRTVMLDAVCPPFVVCPRRLIRYDSYTARCPSTSSRRHSSPTLRDDAAWCSRQTSPNQA
jgi:ATP-dependent helicase HrpB